MKKLSNKSEDLIRLFLADEECNRISMTKHDIKILYNYYKKANREINKLDDKISKAIYLLEDMPINANGSDILEVERDVYHTLKY